MPAVTPPPFDKLLGKRIAEFRRAAHLTQERLAEQVHVTPETISRVERGATSPSVGTLARIAQVLNLDVGAFFETPVKRIPRDEAIDALVRDLRRRTKDEVTLVHDLAHRVFQFMERRGRKKS